MNYRTKELNARVPNTAPDMITRFRWRAERRCTKLNSARLFRPYTYRWEVCDWLDGRWAVVAMQNVAVPN